MRDEERIEGFFLDQFFEDVLRDFEVGQLRQDFQLELIGARDRAVPRRDNRTNLSRRLPAHEIVITRAAPGPFQD